MSGSEVVRRLTPATKAVAKKAAAKKVAKKAPAKKAAAKKAAKKAPAKKAAPKKAAKKAPAKKAPAKKAPGKKAAPKKAAKKAAPSRRTASAPMDRAQRQSEGAKPTLKVPELPAPPTDPAEILGLSEPFDDSDLRRAWRTFAARHHPDQGGDPVTFTRGRKAYDELRARPR